MICQAVGLSCVTSVRVWLYDHKGCTTRRCGNDELSIYHKHDFCSCCGTGKLSATVFLLEMEVKSLKASLTLESTQSLQKLLTATEKNAAARVTDLNRKAVAA